MATLEDIADEFYLGEDWIIDFSLADESGVAVDPTGGTVEFRIRKGSVCNEYTVGDGLTITDAEGGLGTLLIQPAEQTTYTKGEWSYELWLQLADGTSSVQSKGTLTISASLKDSFP